MSKVSNEMIANGEYERDCTWWLEWRNNNGMRRVINFVLLFSCILAGNAQIPQISGYWEQSGGQDDSCHQSPVVQVDSSRRMPVVDYAFSPKSLILPASLITVGVVGTAIDGMNDFHLFSRKDSVRQIKVDNYLEWGMLGWVFLCDLMGEEEHSWADQLCLVGLGEMINAGLVHGVKTIVNETRPDGGSRSFPSGHTSNVFLGAHIAYKEFKGRNPWLAYSGYAIGLLVGSSRLYNNRHWVADVVAGAGFGILSAELSYLIYFPVRNVIAKAINLRSGKEMVVSPSIVSGGGGIYFVYKF